MELNPNATVDCECISCHHKFSKTLGELNANPNFPCPGGCGIDYDFTKFNADIGKGIDDVIAKVRREFKLK